jgi:hypothetical protein
MSGENLIVTEMFYDLFTLPSTLDSSYLSNAVRIVFEMFLGLNKIHLFLPYFKSRCVISKERDSVSPQIDVYFSRPFENEPCCFLPTVVIRSEQNSKQHCHIKLQIG